MDEKYLKIKNNYFESAEVEGEEYKWMGLRNEDIEHLFHLIEKKSEQTA